MKSFIIKESTHQDYVAVVYTTSYDSFLTHLLAIQEELAAKGVVGTVLFDTLTSKGDVSNRYLKAQFNGEFDKSSFVIVNVPKQSHIREESSRFYKAADKDGLLNLHNTLLTDSQTDRIRRGLVL